MTVLLQPAASDMLMFLAGMSADGAVLAEY